MFKAFKVEFLKILCVLNVTKKLFFALKNDTQQLVSSLIRYICNKVFWFISVLDMVARHANEQTQWAQRSIY